MPSRANEEHWQMSCQCVSEGCLKSAGVESYFQLSKKKNKVRNTEIRGGIPRVNLKVPEVNRRRLFISISILLSGNYSSVQHSYWPSLITAVLANTSMFRVVTMTLVLNH